MCIRRRLKTGINVDLVTGFDMMKKDQREQVMEYIATRKPFLSTMGPPCTSSGSWSHLNRKKYRKTLEESRILGESLANFVVAVAMKQLFCGRHLLIENPRGSEVFLLPFFQRLWNTGRVCKMHVAQCALGLRVLGEPIRKLTCLLYTSPSPRDRG